MQTILLCMHGAWSMQVVRRDNKRGYCKCREDAMPWGQLRRDAVGMAALSKQLVVLNMRDVYLLGLKVDQPPSMTEGSSM